MKITTIPIRTLASLALFSSCGASLNADSSKADNATALNLPGSWVGGAVPGSGDIAIWDSTVTVNRNAALGANTSWQGIRVTNAGGTQSNISATVGTVLTLGSSGIDMSAATIDFRIDNAVDYSTDQAITIASGRELELRNASGASMGSSTLSLGGGGGIRIASSTVFGNSTLSVASSGIRIRSTSGSGFTLSNNLNLNGDLGVGSTLVSGGITWGGAINVGSATRTISVQNSLTDGSVNAMALGATSSVAGSGTLALVNGNASGTVRVLLGSGAGAIASDVVIGSNVAAHFSNSNAFAATTDLTVNGRMRMGNLGSAVNSQTVASLVGSGTIDSGQGSGANLATLTVNGGVATGTSTFSGVIENGAFGAVGVTKDGSTTQILSGANTYTGQTLVSAGTLIINGSHVDGAAVTGQGYGSTLSGHFQVAGGAALAGTGRIAGNNSQTNSNMVLVQNGGSIAPGSNGIESLVLDGANMTGTSNRVLNMAGGASFTFELGGNGASADTIDFWNFSGGDVLLNSNAINLTLSGPQVAGTYTVSLFQFYSDSGVTLTSGGITTGLTIGTLGAGISGTPTLSYNSGGSTIDLTYTVVPEPGTWVLVGLGSMALVLRRRR